MSTRPDERTRLEGDAVLLLVTLLLIIYGSLYPFRLVSAEEVGTRFARLFSSFTIGRSLGDVVANLVLFLPLGFFTARWRRDVSVKSLLTAIGALAAVLGLGLQLAQVLVRHRVPALDDALWNTVGALLGGLAGRAVPMSARSARVDLRSASFSSVLVTSWLAYRLAPFVPALDWQQIKDSLEPLLLDPDLSVPDVARSFAGWLAFALLWEEIPFRRLRRLPWYVVAALTLPAEVVVLRNALTLSSLGGLSAAFLSWSAIRARPGRDAFVAWSVLGTLLILALAPFERRDPPAAFHWLPFYGFLGGSLLVNVQQLFLKLYLYGSALWLLGRAGWTLPRSCLAVSLLVFFLELAQTRVAGRVPELTDAVLVILAAALYHALGGVSPVPDPETSPR